MYSTHVTAQILLFVTGVLEWWNLQKTSTISNRNIKTLNLDAKHVCDFFFFLRILDGFIHLIWFRSIQILSVAQDNGLYPEEKKKQAVHHWANISFPFCDTIHYSQLAPFWIQKGNTVVNQKTTWNENKGEKSPIWKYKDNTFEKHWSITQ